MHRLNLAIRGCTVRFNLRDISTVRLNDCKNNEVKVTNGSSSTQLNEKRKIRRTQSINTVKKNVHEEIKKTNDLRSTVDNERKEILCEIVTNFINDRNYNVAYSALKRIYSSGNMKIIDLIHSEKLKRLLRELKKNISKNPKEYIWFLKCLIMKENTLSTEDILFIMKYFIALRIKDDAYKVIESKRDLILKENPNAIYQLFEEAVKHNNPNAAIFIINHLFVFDIHYKNKDPNRYFPRKFITPNFIRRMIPINYNNVHDNFKNAQEIKSIVFICTFFDTREFSDLTNILVSFLYTTYYRNNMNIQKDINAEIIPLLKECETILYDSTFIPSNKNCDEEKLFESINKYLSNYSSKDSDIQFSKNTEYKLLTDVINEKFTDTQPSPKLLLSFAYACKYGFRDMVFVSLEHILSRKKFFNDINFILYALYHSKFDQNIKYVIALKILSSSEKITINTYFLRDLSELAVSFKKDELLVRIHNILTSNNEYKPAHFYILTACAINKNKLEFVKLHLMNYVNVILYSYIKDFPHKLDAAVNVLKIIDISSQEIHFAEILTWSNVEENIKYILYSLVSGGFYTSAAAFFIMSLNYYPNIINMVNTQLLLDLVKHIPSGSDKPIELFSKFIIKTNQTSDKVISAIENIIIKLTNKDYVHNDFSNNTIFSRNALRNVLNLFTYALTLNPLQFSKYIVHMASYLVNNAEVSLAISFIKDVYDVIDPEFVLDTHNTPKLIDSNKSINALHLYRTGEAFILLGEHLLKNNEFVNLMTLLQISSTRIELFRIIFPSSGFPLSDTVLNSITNHAVRDENGKYYLDNNYIKFADQMIHLLYDIIKNNPSIALIATKTFKKFNYITKNYISHTKDFNSKNEFNESMHNAIMYISMKDDLNYNLKIRNCVDILLRQDNLNMLSKNYDIIDALSLKLIIFQIINCVVSRRDACLILDHLDPEAIARMRLNKNEFGKLLKLLVLYKRFQYGYLVIKETVLKSQSNSLNIISTDLAIFMDACILNDYVHNVGLLINIPKLINNIYPRNDKLLNDVKFKYYVCKHMFDEAKITFEKAIDDIRDSMKKLFILFTNKRLNNTKIRDKEDVLDEHTNNEKFLNNVFKGKYNFKKVECRIKNQDHEYLHQETLSFTKFQDPKFLEFIEYITPSKLELNSELSIPTLVYSLRMFLLLEQQDLIYSFLLYVYVASPILSIDAMCEFLRCFVESRNYKAAYIMVCIIYNCGGTVDEYAVINIFNKLLGEQDIIRAWKFFNIVCILSKKKDINHTKATKMLVDIYSMAITKNGPNTCKVREGIEALNNSREYYIEFNLLRDIKSIFLSNSITKSENESHLALNYKVKKNITNENKYLYVNSNYVLHQYNNLEDKISVDNIEDTYKTLLNIYDETKNNRDKNYKSVSYKYCAVLQKIYNSGYTNQEHLANIISLLYNREHRHSLVLFMRAGALLKHKMMDWFSSSLVHFCLTQPLKLWACNPILNTFCDMKIPVPKLIVEFIVNVLSYDHDAVYVLRNLANKKLEITENLLYLIYINFINRFYRNKDAIKIYKRILLININTSVDITYKTLEIFMYLCKISSDEVNAMHIWTLLNIRGVNPTLKCYDILMEILINANESQKALNVLYNLIKSSGIPVDKYNRTHVRVLLKAGKPAQALDVAMRICNTWREKGLYLPAPLMASELTDLIYYLSKQKLHSKANDARSLMYIFGYKKELLRPFWTSLINMMIDENDAQTLLIFTSIIGTNTLGVWGIDTLIKLYMYFIKYGYHTSAEYIIRYIRNDKNTRLIDPVHFENAVNSFGNLLPCDISINKMRMVVNTYIDDLGILPSKSILETVIEHHLKLNSLEYAEYYLALCKDSNLDVSKELYVKLVYGWIDINIPRRAIRIIQYMITFNIPLNDKLMFGLIWANFKVRSKPKVLDIIQYLDESGYINNAATMLDVLFFAKISNLKTYDAYKEWYANTSFTNKKDIYKENLALTKIYDSTAVVGKIYKQDLLSYSVDNSKTSKMHPIVATSNTAWRVRGLNLSFDIGLYPPDLHIGKYKEFYENCLHDNVQRRNRRGRIRTVTYREPYKERTFTVSNMYKM